MYILEIGLRSTVRSLECLDVQKCVHIYVYIYIYRETNVFFENMIRQKYGEIVPSPRGSILHASRASHLPYYATTVFLRGGTRPIPGAIIYMYTYTYISLAGVLYSVLGHPLGSFSFWYCFEPFENWPPATLLWPWLLNAVWPCYMERWGCCSLGPHSEKFLICRGCFRARAYPSIYPCGYPLIYPWMGPVHVQVCMHSCMHACIHV